MFVHLAVGADEHLVQSFIGSEFDQPEAERGALPKFGQGREDFAKTPSGVFGLRAW